jgi:hypothetical protein
MQLDSEDPNEPGNYDVDGEIPSPKSEPATEKEKPNKSDLHPCLMVLQSYLLRFPLIGRWTILEDVLEHTVEFRITLAKRDSQGDGAKRPPSRA